MDVKGFYRGGLGLLFRNSLFEARTLSEIEVFVVQEFIVRCSETKQRTTNKIITNKKLFPNHRAGCDIFLKDALNPGQTPSTVIPQPLQKPGNFPLGLLHGLVVDGGGFLRIVFYSLNFQ